jgi:hypothetical protein
MNKKVAVITNIPNPYRIPLFNRLHERLNGEDIRLKVIFAASGYQRRKWHIDMESARFNFLFLKPTRKKFGKSQMDRKYG